MSLPINLWQNIRQEDTVSNIVSLVDTVPNPDTILQDFLVQDKVLAFSEMAALENTDMNIFETRVYQNFTFGPESRSLVDTVPAPDTIFQDFFCMDKPDIPIYPVAQIINPGTTLYAGDFGGYIC